MTSIEQIQGVVSEFQTQEFLSGVLCAFEQNEYDIQSFYKVDQQIDRLLFKVATLGSGIINILNHRKRGYLIFIGFPLAAIDGYNSPQQLFEELYDAYMANSMEDALQISPFITLEELLCSTANRVELKRTLSKMFRAFSSHRLFLCDYADAHVEPYRYKHNDESYEAIFLSFIENIQNHILPKLEFEYAD